MLHLMPAPIVAGARALLLILSHAVLLNTLLKSQQC